MAKVNSGGPVEVCYGPRRAVLTEDSGHLTLALYLDDDLVAKMVLGVSFDGTALGAGATLLTASQQLIEETWTAHVGKSVGMHSTAHQEANVALRTEEYEWAVVIRVTEDGFAFRYGLPATGGSLGPEATSISMPASTRAWMLDYQTWYETPRFGAPLDELPPGDYGFPVLVDCGEESFLLISESDISGASSGAHAVFDGHSILISAADVPLSVGPSHRTPWRVLVVGNLAQIVQSNLVDELAPPADPDAFIPRPGRAAWSWWSSQYSGAYLETQKRFTDFAAQQGWEHILVDCGWDPAWVPELVSYASARGVQVHLWSAWDDLDGPANLQKLELWRSWGVAGIKVDFMESESAERYRWYDAIIAETARVGLAVNFHGSVIPRGWARTHPHVVSYEGIRGAEYYVFYGDPLTAAHNVIQPFTRNVVGSMDYTPVTFSAPQRQTSDAHELALGVVYESGITHFADDPEEYRSRPLAAKFLAEIPQVWEETRFLSGHPDTHALLARRGGDRWFVGCIGAEEVPSTTAFDPADLIGGPADVRVVKDGKSGLIEKTFTDTTGRLEIDLVPRGGYVAIVVPSGEELFQAVERHAVALPSAPSSVLILEGPRVQVQTNADRILVPPGWTATAAEDHCWWVGPNQETKPGDLAVITLEGAGYGEVPTVSHVRVLTPMGGAVHDLSALPFLSARNAVGPVERGLANGGGDPRDGGPLKVCGTTYTDGLGVSQSSEVTFAIDGSCARLTGLVAIDDETPEGEAKARILIDGNLVRSFQVVGGTEPVPFIVDTAGAKTISLQTSSTLEEEAHVDWLTLRLGE